MALKDWMEAIMFLCRLSGSTMSRDTAKSRNTRKVLVTWKGIRSPHALSPELTHCQDQEPRQAGEHIETLKH